jgi:hypothetical protein
MPNELYRSPIEQEIIDGKAYWDNLGPEWLRLIDRRTMDVIGHYRRHQDAWMRAPEYIATIIPPSAEPQ